MKKHYAIILATLAVLFALFYRPIWEYQSAAPPPQNAPNDIFVKSDGMMVRVSLPQLLYVRGLKDYVKLVLARRFQKTFCTGIINIIMSQVR